MDKNDIEFLYKPYTKELDKITQKLKKIDNKNDHNGISAKYPCHWKTPLRKIKRYFFKGRYNIFDKKKLLGEK